MPLSFRMARPPALALTFTACLLMGAAIVQADPAIDKTSKIGTGLYEIVVDTTADLVYVAAAGRRGDTQAFIYGLDPKTLEIKKTIDVSAAAAYGLGINQKTQTLFTTNTRANSVSVIDLKDGKVINTIANDGRAHGREIIVDEDANLAYVSMVGGDGATGKIWVVDGAKGTLVEVIDDVGLGVTGLALDKAKNRIYATDMTTRQVAVVDLAEKKVVERWNSDGESPINAAFDAATNRLFVTNQGSGTLTVFDTNSGDIVKTLPTGEGALGVAFSPKSNLVFVANRRAGTVSVVDAAKLEIVASLATGTHPNTVAVDPRSGTAFVSNKAKSGGRNAPPVDDPAGDTVTSLVP